MAYKWKSVYDKRTQITYCDTVGENDKLATQYTTTLLDIKKKKKKKEKNVNTRMCK
jgi:hypothetical protein